MTILSQRPQGFRPAGVPRTLLDDVFGFTPLNTASSGVDITNTENGFTVEIPVPGFRAGEITVTLDENVLTVAAENQRRKLSRSLIVPDTIDTENIEVEVENGMLTLQLKVPPKAQPKKIDVHFRE